MNLKPEIWGPHYWFFLHTITLNYPNYPNDIIKKKYYNLIQNLPIFLPNINISNSFSDLLNEYPISPYLDNKKSLILWMHFIHNKINESINKPKISINQFYIDYFNNYKDFNINIKIKNLYKFKKKIYIFLIILLLILIIYFYY